MAAFGPLDGGLGALPRGLQAHYHRHGRRALDRVSKCLADFVSSFSAVRECSLPLHDEVAAALRGATKLASFSWRMSEGGSGVGVELVLDFENHA